MATTTLREIFERIAVHHEVPMRLSNRCETNVFYRVEDLSPEDLDVCGDYLEKRIVNVCQPVLPQLIIRLPGCFTELPEVLSRKLAPPGEVIEVITIDDLGRVNGKKNPVQGVNILLVNDVVTTARSCLEAHTKTTMLGGIVSAWAALIDRTFGPGPVPVIAAYTGAPVTLLE